MQKSKHVQKISKIPIYLHTIKCELGGRYKVWYAGRTCEATLIKVTACGYNFLLDDYTCLLQRHMYPKKTNGVIDYTKPLRFTVTQYVYIVD